MVAEVVERYLRRDGYTVSVVHDGMAFSEELKLEAIRSGARFRELPIAYRERLGEKKIRSVPDATANLVWLVRKRAGWVPRSRVG